MENTSTSAFARLLATENIRVRHLADAETASFDVVDRVLTLPKWKNMSENLYDMLIGHEVAHALWTPGDLAEDGEHLAAAVEIDPDNPMRAMGFLNVVEDARIERLIKDKYPGLRRDFVSGYRWLWENMDLFQSVIEEHGGVSNMMLTDRLNLHFKLGIMGILSIPFFTDEERSFVSRIEVAETFDDVMDITRDLYEHEKNAMQDRPGTSDGKEMMESPDGEPMREPVQNESSPVTENIMGEGLDQFRDHRSSHREGTATIPQPNMDKIVVGVDEMKDLLAHPRNRWTANSIEGERDRQVEIARGTSRVRFDAWVRNEMKTINYLVKQFELKKAADEHQRTMITKSGRLDTVKMINYKWSEDIFGKNMIVREGKNHGFVFMLDWSGSMNEVLEPTVKQAILLCLFCQKIGVPFDLYAFSSHAKDTNGGWFPKYEYEDPENSTISKDHWEHQEGEDKLGPFQMLHFLSSTRKRKDLNEDMANLFYLAEAAKGRWEPPVDGGWGVGGAAHVHDALDLGGTPLDEGIICLHHLLPEFRRRTGVQVLNCVILTDGDGCSNLPSTLYNPMLRRNFGDHPTHKNPKERPDSTNSLLLSLKETTGCNLIGMYLFGGRNPANCYGWYGNGDSYWQTDEQKTQAKYDSKVWKKENFMIATGPKAFAYDEAYIIAATTDVLDEIEIPEDATHTKMRNAFVKGMSQRSMSRVLSNRLVDRIAC